MGKDRKIAYISGSSWKRENDRERDERKEQREQQRPPGTRHAGLYLGAMGEAPRVEEVGLGGES